LSHTLLLLLLLLLPMCRIHILLHCLLALLHDGGQPAVFGRSAGVLVAHDNSA
jgi:hypothetical protein